MRCGYIRWIWDCGNTREVEEKHTGRYGARGQKRQKRRKATPEEIAKQNQWKRERDVRRLIKWNFGIGDYWFTLTYKKGQKCYFQNKKVRKRECAIQPASCMTRAAGPAISVLRFTITGMNTGSLMSIMCSEDQTGRTPRNMV